MNTLFLLFACAMVVVVTGGMVHYLPHDYKTPALIGLAAWVAYGGMLAYAGVIGNASLMPPGLFYLLAPMVLLVMFTARSRVGLNVALSFPTWLLMGTESFRLVVEIFLDQLWRDGQLPKMMTFHGANFDILIGASAPLMAWWLALRKISDRAALAWNVLGIAMLANVALRGVLTAPGPLHLIATEVPNTAIGTLPFSYIPGLMVPLALLLHVLAIRALRHRIRQAARPTFVSTQMEQENAAANAYRFTRLSTSLFIQDLGFSRTDAKPGDTVRNVSLERLDGSPTTLEALTDGWPTLIVFGSVSCPMTFGSITVLRRLQDEFGQQIKFLMLNVREAHPGENFEQPQSQELKRSHARLLAAEANGPWETVVDSIDGALHRALAEKPNAAFLLAPNRRILFRALWGGDERALRQALAAVATASPLKESQSSSAYGPLAIGFGFFAPILARSGKKAKRELLLAAPPVAMMAALASMLRSLPLERRGAVALIFALFSGLTACAALAWILSH